MKARYCQTSTHVKKYVQIRSVGSSTCLLNGLPSCLKEESIKTSFMQETGRLLNPFPMYFTGDKIDRLTEKCLFLQKQHQHLFFVIAYAFLFTP